MADVLSNVAHTVKETASNAVSRFQKLYEQMSRREVGHATVDRDTGYVHNEKVPLAKQLQLELMYNAFMDTIDQTGAVRHMLHDQALLEGRREASPQSKNQIKTFVDFHEIDMSQFEPGDINEFRTFDDFFTRTLKPGVRPIYAEGDNSIAVSAADCRLVVFKTVEESKKLWIKGKHFTIAQLIDDQERAKTWNDGAIASFRLSPQDYHHYHSPVSGTVEWVKEIPGNYYAVSPNVTSSPISNLGSNHRACISINSPDFGRVLYVAIGAEDVGAIKLAEHIKVGQQINKGDEIGLFFYGGSNVLVAWEPNRIDFDDDLIDYTHKKLEVNMLMGQRIGIVHRREE